MVGRHLTFQCKGTVNNKKRKESQFVPCEDRHRLLLNKEMTGKGSKTAKYHVKKNEITMEFAM